MPPRSIRSPRILPTEKVRTGSRSRSGAISKSRATAIAASRLLTAWRPVSAGLVVDADGAEARAVRLADSSAQPAHRLLREKPKGTPPPRMRPRGIAHARVIRIQHRHAVAREALRSVRAWPPPRLRWSRRTPRAHNPRSSLRPFAALAIAARSRISPAWFIPISSTAARQSSGSRRMDSGTPTWLLKLPIVFPTCTAAEAGARWRPWLWSCPRCPLRPPPFRPIAGAPMRPVAARRAANRGTTSSPAIPLARSTTTAAAPFSAAVAQNCARRNPAREARNTHRRDSVSACPRSSRQLHRPERPAGAHGSRNFLQIQGHG